MVQKVEQYADMAKPDAEKGLLKPPLGDLIVLLNPAAEAEKWVAHQRAFRRRMNAETDTALVQKAYAVRQPPIYMSLTAARSWPANGIRPSDVNAIKRLIDDEDSRREPAKRFNTAGKTDCALIRHFDGDYRPTYEYDTATYDIFPFFKLDFRPLAQTLEDHANPDPYNCDQEPIKPGEQRDTVERPGKISRFFWRSLAALLRNFPFMNTDVEQTRTIGHLDPMRAPFGQLFGREQYPATWYGTTHELLMNFQHKQLSPDGKLYVPAIARYTDASNVNTSECAVVDGWLSTARTTRAVTGPEGPVNWDSGWSSRREQGKIVPGEAGKPNLTPIRPRPDSPAEHIESQFRQTFFFSGFKAIAGANDPFWNVRAFDSALAHHNDYVSYPLICAIFQFAMDKVTDDAIPAASPK
jgi:hypothetical protein